MLFEPIIYQDTYDTLSDIVPSAQVKGLIDPHPVPEVENDSSSMESGAEFKAHVKVQLPDISAVPSAGWSVNANVESAFAGIAGESPATSKRARIALNNFFIFLILCFPFLRKEISGY